MATLSPEQAALLRSTYGTADKFQSSSAYANLSEPLRQASLGAFSSNVDPSVLQAQSSAPITNTPTPTVTPTVVQEGDKWRVGSQLFNSEAGANAALQRITTAQASQQNNTNTPTTPTTPTQTTTGKPSYTDIGEQRMSDIQTNLTRYAETNPELFMDVAQYRNFFDYNQRVPEQKAALDAFFSTQKTKMEGQKAMTLRYNELLSMSEQDLMGITDSNDLNLINQDPNLKAKYDAAKKNKEMFEFIYGKDYNKEKLPEIDGLDNLPDNIKIEIANASAIVTDTKQKMDEIQDQMENTYDDLVKQHEGAGVTDQYLRAKANKINSELQKQYNDLGRDYNRQIGTVNTLISMVEMQREEENAKKQDWAFRLGMYEFMYGDYGDRNQAQAGVEVQTKDFGTAKSPNWMQSLDGGRTRQPIEGITGVGGGAGGGGAGGGSGTGGVGSASYQLQQDLIARLNRIKNAANSSVFLSTSTFSPQIQKDIDYVKNNLTFDKLSDMKKAGVKLGVLSDSDMRILASAATSLGGFSGGFVSKEYTTGEVNRIIQKLGGNTQSTSKSNKGTTTNSSQGTTSLGVRVGSSQYSRF